MAALAALTMMTATTATTTVAMAGERERDFLKGVAATVIVGAIVNDIKQKSRAQAQRRYVEPQRYYQPQPVYAEPRRHVERTYQPSIYNIPAAQTFNNYSPRDKRAIQQELARFGYYRGSIDGIWGPGTHRAVQAYARDTGYSGGIGSQSGAYSFYDGLLG